MTDERKSSRRRALLAPAAVLLILVGVGVWLMVRTKAAPQPEAADEPDVAVSQPAPRAARPRPAAPAPAANPDAKKFELEYAPDGVPYMPAGPNDPHPNTFVHPHPITEQHKRIYRENAILYQLNEAMDGREVERLRKQLQEYRDEYPEDPHDMQKGYALIADCIEHPGDPAIRAQAQKYFNEEIASTLRRFVLRHCLQ